MKLTDLRDELTARADSADDRAPDLLPGVRRKITQTKRRRTVAVSGFVGCVAVIAALATGIIPGLTKTAPPPAEDIPTDYVKNGITLRGAEGADRLLKGWVGEPGENTIDFTWIPTTKNVAFYPYCRGGDWTMPSLRVELNGQMLFGRTCDDTAATTPSREHRDELLSDAPEWLDMPLGKPVQVKITLKDPTGGTFKDSSTQLALGIYSTPGTTTLDGLPRQEAPTGSADYAKGGYRYRAQIGGTKLLGAVIGDPGQSRARFELTGTGGPIVLHDFCTANPRDTADAPYSLGITIPGLPKRSSSCGEASTDLGTGGSTTLPAEQAIAAGKKVEVTLTLEDSKGNPVSKPGSRIGLGIYQDGPKRTYPAGNDQPDFSLDEIIEVGGHNYKLADVRTADATSGSVELATPAGKPFFVSFGPSDITDADEVTVHFSGVSHESTIMTNATTPGGLGRATSPARDTGTATLQVTSGTPTKGKLLLALYLPAN